MTRRMMYVAAAPSAAAARVADTLAAGGTVVYVTDAVAWKVVPGVSDPTLRHVDFSPLVRLAVAGDDTGADAPTPVSVGQRGSILRTLLDDGCEILAGRDAWEALLPFLRCMQERSGVTHCRWVKYERSGDADGAAPVFFVYEPRPELAVAEREMLAGFLAARCGEDPQVLFPVGDLAAACTAWIAGIEAGERQQRDVLAASAIRRLDHVGIVSPREPAIEKFLHASGWRLAYEGPVPQIDVLCRYFIGPDVDLELVRPLSERSAVWNHHARFPMAPLHHLAYEVEDLEASLTYFAGAGYRRLPGGPYFAPKPQHEVVFLSPIYTGGLLVELVHDLLPSDRFRDGDRP